MREPFTAAAGFLLLAACASPPGRPLDTDRPAPAAALAQSGAAAKATFDWRPLVLAPFGSLLKDNPVRLHEVLLFRDRSHAPTEIESKDCYTVDGTPPTFMGRVPVEYLMCYEHDRLDRIEAMVRMRTDEAARDFGRACALWLARAQPLTQADGACEGRDGDIAFSARLDPLDERSAQVALVLADAAKRDAEREPPRDLEVPSPAAP